MKRQTKGMSALAGIALAMVLTAGAVASAQIYDRPYSASVVQTRQYGYDSGYRDGVSRGQHEGRENDPYDYRTPDWRQATRGYQPWMGPLPAFQQGYQQGYAAGFQSGLASVRPAMPYVAREDFRPVSYPPAPYPEDRYVATTAYNFGREDGAETAREDIYHRKPYNPVPRDRYSHMDHGYQHQFGDKEFYRSKYDEGYRAGYDSVFNRRY